MTAVALSNIESILKTVTFAAQTQFPSENWYVDTQRDGRFVSLDDCYTMLEGVFEFETFKCLKKIGLKLILSKSPFA